MRAAATKGIRFGQAYVPSPLCAPVRACLAAGKEYDQAGVPQNHGDDWPLQQETFYKILRDEANYTVMSCGKDDLYKNDINFPFYKKLDIKETAIDLGFTNAMRSAGKTKVTKGGPPFEAYREFLENTMVGDEPQAKAFNVYTQCHDGPTGADGNWTSDTLCTADKFTEQIYPDNFVAAEAMKLIGLRDKSKPFFLQINFPGPHYPMVCIWLFAPRDYASVSQLTFCLC
jgi:arylsulfatase A-like enzyme